MKSLITAFIIAAVVIGTSLYCSHQIDKLTNELTKKNDILLKNITDENFDEALKLLDDIDKTIENSSVLLASYLDHSELQKIETQLVQLDVYIREQEKITALANVNTLNLLFNHLPEDYHVRLENIF